MNFLLIDRATGGRTASALAASCSLSAEARTRLDAGPSPSAFFSGLVADRLDADALGFLAHALPKRAAVWWGALCFWDASRPRPSELEDAALRAAVRWAIDPSEPNRTAALEPGHACGMRSPAGCLALAATWSAGCLSPPGLPPVPTPDDATGRLVAGSVLMAAVRGDASAFRDRYREFLAIGSEVASGRNLWAEGDPIALLGLTPPPSARASGPAPSPFNVAPAPLHPLASAR